MATNTISAVITEYWDISRVIRSNNSNVLNSHRLSIDYDKSRLSLAKSIKTRMTRESICGCR